MKICLMLKCILLNIKVYFNIFIIYITQTAHNEAVGKVNLHEKACKKYVILGVFSRFLCKN